MGREEENDWNQFLNDSAKGALELLRARLATSAVPVWYYQNFLDAPDRLSFVANRDKPLPAVRQPDNPLTSSDQLRVPTASQRGRSSVLLTALDAAKLANYYSDKSRDWFAKAISYQFDPNNAFLKKWDGLVLDLSGESLSAAQAHLDSLPAPKPAPATVPHP